MVEYNDPLIIFFFVFGFFSMFCTLLVLIDIMKSNGMDEIKTDTRIRLLFLLHITIFFEDLSNFPLIYTGNQGMCEFMGWLHFYTGLANILVISFLGLHHFSYLNLETLTTRIEKLLNKYSLYIIFIFPLITLFPFITNSYADYHGDWCTLPSNERTSNNWAIACFYLWAILFIFGSFFQLVKSIYKFHKYQLTLHKRLFLSVGCYILISLFCWIPRVIPRIIHVFVDFTSSYQLVIWTTFPLYVSGVLNMIVYILDYIYLSNDRTTSRVGSVNSDQLGSIHLTNIDKLFEDSVGGGSGKGSAAVVDALKSSIKNPLQTGEP